MFSPLGYFGDGFGGAGAGFWTGAGGGGGCLCCFGAGGLEVSANGILLLVYLAMSIGCAGLWVWEGPVLNIDEPAWCDTEC